MKLELDKLDKISLVQIRVFSEILSQSNLLQIDYIKKRYLEKARNFTETVNFLSDLNLIRIVKNQVRIKTEYSDLIRKCRNSTKTEKLISEFLVNYSINNKTTFSSYLNEFLANFQINNSRYEYLPNTTHRLKYSGLRNLLIELGLLHLDSEKNSYIIDSNYLLSYFQNRKPRPITQDEFTRIQQKRAEIGYRAELKILELEKLRLSQYPDLVMKIEHVAKDDVTAGYDIKSFDTNFDNSDINPKYIEVKAVSIWDYQFYWTANEIEKSRVNRDNYFLYLLPVLTKEEFDMENLKVIPNPYEKVYKNKNEWNRKNESISFSIKNLILKCD